MNPRRHLEGLLGAAAVVLACATAAPGAIAAPTIFVRTDFSTNSGLFAPTTTTTSATARTSTSQLDAANFAMARADASAGSVGIGMATTLAGASAVSASASADIRDDWVPCSATCLTTIDLAPVTFNMHFEGSLSAAWLATHAIEGESTALNGSFAVSGDRLDFAWDGAKLAGTFCNGSPTPVCAPFTFASTTLADGSLSFDDDVSFTGTVTALGFSTELALGAGWDGTKQPSLVDFLHTLSFDIVSNDPRLAWVSDAGQISHIATVGAVPEPKTVALLGLGLLVLGPLARRRRARAAADFGVP
jgi:hypothetical protein